MPKRYSVSESPRKTGIIPTVETTPQNPTSIIPRSDSTRPNPYQGKTPRRSTDSVNLQKTGTNPRDNSVSTRKSLDSVTSVKSVSRGETKRPAVRPRERTKGNLSKRTTR